jgi:hypothetical protein
MRSSSREEIVEVFDALKAGMKRALDLTFDVLTTPERLGMLRNCEEIRRVLLLHALRTDGICSGHGSLRPLTYLAFPQPSRCLDRTACGQSDRQTIDAVVEWLAERNRRQWLCG